jgi:MoaA/NifB/PqqE/SkfB family radical SAM enzyme
MLSHPASLRRLVIEPTYACNLRCQHCYVRRSAGAVGQFAQLGHSRTVSFWQSVLQKTPQNLQIHFTGGELFSYPGIFSLLEYTRDRFPFTLSTNGTTLNQEDCRRLAELYPRHITISLLGPKQIHDAITGLPGSYDRAIAAIQALIRLLPRETLSVNFVLLPVNAMTLDEVVRVVECLGVGKMVVQLFDPALNRCGIVAGVENIPPPEYLDWSETDLGILQRSITHIQHQRRERLDVLLASEMTSEEIIRFISGDLDLKQWTCAEVFDTLRCSPTGQAYTCTGLALGSLDHRSPLEIWESPGFMAFRQSHIHSGLPSDCLGCCKIRRIYES